LFTSDVYNFAIMKTFGLYFTPALDIICISHWNLIWITNHVQHWCNYICLSLAKSIWRITAQAPAQSQAIMLGIFYLMQINWESKIVSSAEVRISAVSLLSWHWALSFAKAPFQLFFVFIFFVPSTIICIVPYARVTHSNEK